MRLTYWTGLSLLFASVASFGAASGGDRVLYDERSGCAVFDVSDPPSDHVTWQGDCLRGNANGKGTASFSNGETITAVYQDGHLVDGQAQIEFSDGARFEGEAVAGKPQGTGKLKQANGDMYEGTWKAGKLDGQGTARWANGDRYDGAWLNGKAEGHGVQIWANGERYDGSWHNDLPDGSGVIAGKDGIAKPVTYVAGHRQPELVSAGPTPATPSASAAAVDGLDGFASQTLAAIDGSSIVLKKSPDGLARTLTAPDGKSETLLFHPIDSKLGSIADSQMPAQLTGVYRVSTAALDAEFTDGHTERMALLQGGGLSLVIRTQDGVVACRSWYPDGHVYSDAERKAAVLAYARKLGVTSAKSTNASCVAPSTSRVASAPLRTGPLPLATVAIKDSKVHPIDPLQRVSDTVGLGDEPVASQCLAVDSAQGYLGFRNHCTYDVQFAYCLSNGADELTACSTGTGQGVAGSAAARSFAALFADRTLSEQDFRWVACRGGAGEVVAKLDSVNPVAGRCVHGTTRQASN